MVFYDPFALAKRVTSNPTVFALTDNQATNQLLTDIPFYSVGLLSFGAFTAFIILRKVTGLSTYVYASTLLAFMAAILDLAQLLLRGSFTANDGLSLSSVSGLIIVREIQLSLSIGFRFLFFWTLAGKCPSGETPTFVPTSMGGYETHSGEWNGLGIFGSILQWLTFLLIPVTTIIQVVWRVVPALRVLGPVYFLDNALEIALSVIFILKLTASSMAAFDQRTALIGFAAPISALLIGFGVAIGNLACFLFSEATLGRFLQSLELYILLVYILVSTFYYTRTRDSIASFGSLRKPNNALFSEKGRSSPSFDILPAAKNIDEDGQTGRNGVWENQGDVEAGMRPPGLGLRFENLPTQTNAVREVKLDRSDTTDTTVTQRGRGQSAAYSIDSYYNSNKNAPPVPVLPSSGFLSANPQGSTSPSRISMVTTMSDSPVYGLNGVRANQDHTSMNSFDHMLYQQQELDRSIAALRLISPVGTTFEELAGSTAPPTMTKDSETSGASKNGRKNNVVSVASEFSLRMFPVPPTARSTTIEDAMPSEVFSATVVPMPKPAAALIAPLKKKRSRSRESNIPPPISIPDQESRSQDQFPQTAEPLVTAKLSRSRVSTEGTQYDVTSFIGDFTAPVTGLTSTRSEQFEDLRNVDKADVSSRFKDEYALSLGPATASSGLLTATPSQTSKLPVIITTNISPTQDDDASDLLDGMIVKDSSTPLETSSLGTVTIPVSASLNTGDATRKSVGLPPRPKLAGPRPLTIPEKAPST